MKKIIIIAFVLFILVIGGILTYKYIDKNFLDEEGVPYIYIKGNNQMVKACRYDGYKKLFDDMFSNDIHQPQSAEEFYYMWELNNDNFLEYKADDVIYFDVYSSDKSEFSIDGMINLMCSKGDLYSSKSGGTKESIFKDKEIGNLIKVGFTKSPTFAKNKDIIKIFKIDFKEYGVHYYSVIVNKSAI